MDARFYPEEERREYSLVRNGKIVVKATDKTIAEKWLEKQLEEGYENSYIVENLEKDDTCILI